MDKPTEISNKLLVKYLNNKCTPKELKTVKDWIAFDKKNELELLAFQKIWLMSQTAKTINTIDNKKAWKNVNTKLELSKNRKRYFFRATAVVAALFIAFIGVKYLYYPSSISQLITYTAENNNDSIVLSDGSKVWLYKGSSISYPSVFNTNNRKILLSGEAYFKVAKEKHKPFTVSFNHTETTVLGTEFNLRPTQDKGVELVLVEGRVQFSYKAKKVNVLPSEKVVAYKGVINKSSNDNPNFNSWKTKVFTFNNTTFDQVISELNRVYSDEIIVKNPKLLNQEITIDFDNENLQEILETLDILLEFDLQYKNKQYLIY